MKRLFLLFALSFSLALAYDGTAGPSLNRNDTIDEYARLVDLSEQAIKTGNPKIKTKAVEGIEDFLNVVDEYRNVSSSGAKRYLEMYEKDLEKRLKEVNKID